MDLHGVRRDYTGDTLPDDPTTVRPWELLGAWLDDALGADEPEPTAMVLSTVGADGAPRGRVVLAKEATERGIVFFSHYDSPKGEDLDVEPAASVVFWWPSLIRQVRAVGRVSRLSREENEAYFASRPRESQVGAWASHQSRPLESRAALVEAVAEASRRFDGEAVPCPPEWGGFLIDVEEFEFWQGQPSRLNDRIQLRRSGDGWTATRLQP